MGGEQRGQAAVVQPAGQWRITDGRGRWRGRGGAMVRNGRVEAAAEAAVGREGLKPPLPL